MTADDTSREALIERVEELLHDLWNSRGRVDAQATAVVDAVVMPLVQERDRLRAERAPYDFVISNDGTVHPASRRAIEWERDAAIKRAEAAEAERDLLEAERDQALAELDDRFAESDHKAAKWYRKWREATK